MTTAARVLCAVAKYVHCISTVVRKGGEESVSYSLVKNHFDCEIGLKRTACVAAPCFMQSVWDRLCFSKIECHMHGHVKTQNVTNFCSARAQKEKNWRYNRGLPALAARDRRASLVFMSCICSYGTYGLHIFTALASSANVWRFNAVA